MITEKKTTIVKKKPKAHKGFFVRVEPEELRIFKTKCASLEVDMQAMIAEFMKKFGQGKG